MYFTPLSKKIQNISYFVIFHLSYVEYCLIKNALYFTPLSKKIQNINYFVIFHLPYIKYKQMKNT
ncbi:hypothetical protein [uncultured Gammaproteobacteria bacterium]|nr:hypothetical protein [uncultured Gammaproteobacteria bacterium]